MTKNIRSKKPITKDNLMFKKILIPISSEFYSKKVLRRGAELAKKFQSKIFLTYILEKKTLDQTDKQIDSYRTPEEIKQTRNEIKQKQKQTAYDLVFQDANYLIKKQDIPYEEKIIEGQFSEAVQREIENNDYDLIIIGFQKECLLRYRLLDEVDIPVWVEAGRKSKKILSVCSNLAPNKKVPEISMKLQDTLGWDLKMLYVVDIIDNVQVDEECRRSSKKPQRDLVFNGQNFIEKIEKQGINIEMRKGRLEKEILRTAEEINAGLIILGREQKKKGALGFPIKNVKRKIAEKCRYSILFIN